MSYNVITPSKPVGARIPITFPMGGMMEFGETITGVSMQAVVAVGEDPSPGDIIYGPATVSGQSVTQVVEGGVAGNIYQVTALVTGSGGHVYSKATMLSVVNLPEAFIGI